MGSYSLPIVLTWSNFTLQIPAAAHRCCPLQNPARGLDDNITFTSQNREPSQSGPMHFIHNSHALLYTRGRGAHDRPYFMENESIKKQKKNSNK